MSAPREMSGRSRREFLASTAVAGAAAFLGGTAEASFRKPWKIPRARRRIPLATNEPIRIGVIGPGGMGHEHIRRFIAINKDGQEYVHVVGVSDCCTVRMDDALKTIKDGQPDAECTAHQDYRELLNRDDIHGVLIATPEHWHGPMAREAIAAGKDVYCEKPMTLRLEDAVHLREVQDANPDIRVQVGTQYMMYPKYNEAARLIKEGAIGHPCWSQTSYCRNSLHGEWLYYGIDNRIKPGQTIDWRAWCGPLGERPWNHEIYHRWRRYKDFSTGIIGDLLVHQVTPLMMAIEADWPTRVVGTGGHYIDKAMENHDQVNIQVQFGGQDHTMVVAGSTCNDQGLEIMIRGHKATMYLGSNNVDIRPQQIFVEEEGLEPQTVQCENIGDPQVALRVNWLNCMRTREPVKSPVEFATKVMVMVDLATRSMWTGRAWEFDHETMTARAI